MKIYFVPFILILLFINYTALQAQKGSSELALEYLTQGNFELALEEYLLLVAESPENEKYNYRLAVCYLNTNIDKTKAIPYLNKVTQMNGKYDNNAHYLLGRAYHFNQEFDKAIEQYTIYTNKGGGTAATPKEIEKHMEYCYNAKELIKFPINVKFENLGASINSIDQDYFPFFPLNESFILYNSKKPIFSDLDEDEANYSNVFISNVKKGKFLKALPLNINTNSGTEEIVGLSANGDILLLYLNNNKAKGDLFISYKNDSSFSEPQKLDDVINSNAQEIAASINKEGDIIYFASDREGGLGGTDIYMCRKLPTGVWGPAKNLGPSVNTPFDEDFPNISPDGKTLYFSSKGHTSMGGYDIFTSIYNESTNTFENPRNIGYPLNTVFDDMNFRVSQTGKYGYIAALRPEGLGDYDIYRVTFNDIETQYTVVKGYIKTPNNEPIEEIIIDITNTKDGELYGTYQPNFNSLRYIMILPPGEYDLYIESPGYKKIEEKITIYDKSSFIPEIIKDIELQEEN